MNEENKSSDVIIKNQNRMYFYSLFSQGYQESAMTFERHEHQDKIKVASYELGRQVDIHQIKHKSFY